MKNNWKLVVLIATSLSCTTLSSIAAKPARVPGLQLTKALELPGNFLGEQCIASDKVNLYAANAQGQAFMIGKQKLNVKCAVEVNQVGIRSVSVSGDKLYTAGADGFVSVYKIGRTSLTLVNRVQWSPYGLQNLYADGPVLIASLGLGSMASDGSLVFVSFQNEGEGSVIGSSADLNVIGQFGGVLTGTTDAYDLITGQYVTSVPNISDMYGNCGVNTLMVSRGLLFQTTPGCCGSSMVVYNVSTMSNGVVPLPAMVLNRPHINAATMLASGYVIVGTESGMVEAYVPTADPTAPYLLSQANIRTLTGFNGPEDIEIRAVIADGDSNRVFCASSGGRWDMPTPGLPKIFALDLR